jgi:hypothetical protein
MLSSRDVRFHTIFPNFGLRLVCLLALLSFWAIDIVSSYSA